MSSPSSSRRLLDPIERTSEVLFGLIMVLTFTTSISVANDGEAEMRAVLVGAIGCNLAWGLVDATMYLMANFMARARGLATVRAVRQTRDPGVASQLILDALPPLLSRALVTSDVESLRQRLSSMPDPASDVSLGGADYARALGIFLLVFLATFPVVVPFVVMSDAATALRTSNAIAVLMLFGTGWSLGRHAGRPAWRTALAMVAIGISLVAIAMALGG